MRKFNKLFILISIILLSISCMGCKSDYESFIDQFDLEDEKIEWDGDINDPLITGDAINVTLKKAKGYLEVKLSDFGLDNALGMKYIYDLSSFNKLSNTGNWRQIIRIYLKSESRDKLLETIRKVEQLEFVKKVEPEFFVTGDV